MMDISQARGMFATFHGHLISIVHADGTDWTGVITGLVGMKKDDMASAKPDAVIFTLIRDVEGYKKARLSSDGSSHDRALRRGKKKTLWLTDIREIHEL